MHRNVAHASAPSSNHVLNAFIAQANASYRAAGLSEYQMRVGADGQVTQPNRPKVGAAADATRGAAAVAAVSAPQLAQVSSPTADSVQLTWQPVAGATKYGIWQDGQLIGTVPNPTFTANIAANSTSTLAIDAEFASGQRSTQTQPVTVSRQGDAAVQAQVGNAAAAQQGASTVPTAAVDASAGAAATHPSITNTPAATPATAGAAAAQ